MQWQEEEERQFEARGKEGRSVMNIARPDPEHEAGMQLLVLTSDQEIYDAACRLLQHSNWHVQRAHSLAEAKTKLCNRVAVALCTAQFEGGTWRDLLTEIRDRECPVSLVVADRQASEGLWTDVLDEGGYDVLSYPFDSHELFRIVTQGWRHWRHQRASRARQPSAAGMHA